jgi:polar amino acid transport system substrate-binding protein
MASTRFTEPWACRGRAGGRRHWTLPLLGLLGLSLVSILDPGSARGDALARIRAAGVLRWGGDVQGGEPYVFLDPQDPARQTGFEVELAQALAAELGVRAEFAQNAWPTLAAALDRGDFDIILNGWEDTPARRATQSLTRPYYRYGERLTVRRGTPAFTLADLRGRRVATLASTYAHLLLDRVGAHVLLYEGAEEPYLDLLAGRVEAVLLDDLIAERYAVSHPELVSLGDVAVGGYVMAARKSEPELARALDGALDRVEARGELTRILDRWCLWNARQRPACAARSGAEAPLGAPGAQDPAGSLAKTLARPLGGQGVLFLRGAAVTALVSIAAMALAVPLGMLLGLGRLYGSRLVSFGATAYVELWRGTPVLLQLYVLYFGLAPLVHLNALTAAILGLGMNYAAYEAEVYRGALQSLPIGQSEAALALGLSRWQTIRYVLLPQAVRHALPAVTNDFVALLKDSSLVSVITVVELTKQMTITAVDVRSWAVPGAACAGLYFAMSWPLSRLARHLERRLGG